MRNSYLCVQGASISNVDDHVPAGVGREANAMVVSLSHVPMLSHPREVVRVIAEASAARTNTATR